MYDHPMIGQPSIVLALLTGRAIAFAIPQLRDSYAGAVLSGTCRPSCDLPEFSIVSPQYP